MNRTFSKLSYLSHCLGKHLHDRRLRHLKLLQPVVLRFFYIRTTTKIMFVRRYLPSGFFGPEESITLDYPFPRRPGRLGNLLRRK